MKDPLLDIEDLRVYFPVRGGIWLRPVAECKAVDGVSLQIQHGETLGLVGESGCGKSTLARCVVGLNQPTSGKIFLEGKELNDFTGQRGRILRKRVQMVFQDPAESLNARHTVGQILEEPLLVHQEGTSPERKKRVGGTMCDSRMSTDELGADALFILLQWQNLAGWGRKLRWDFTTAVLRIQHWFRRRSYGTAGMVEAI